MCNSYNEKIDTVEFRGETWKIINVFNSNNSTMFCLANVRTGIIIDSINANLCTVKNLTKTKVTD